MAQSPISRFLTDRFITPAVQAQLPAVQKDTSAYAVGVIPQPNITLRDTLGQFPDSDYNLLYAIYQAHVDVSSCVAMWAGGVTGNGWHIGLLDKEAEPTAGQQKVIDEITTWLKNPNPTKRFSRVLYEMVEHMAITGDAYINKVTDSKGHIQELWSIHPATVRIVADEHGAIHGYIQRYRGVNVAQFQPEEISRFQLPSALNDLYGHSPLESALGEVNVDLRAMAANKAIFDNGFKPSVILMMKDGVKDAAERIANLIKQKHTGATNQHGVMTVSGVEKVEQYGSNLKDMEFTALRELTTIKVANAYRVPAIFLNQKGTSKYTTINAEERNFFNTTIKPVQDIIAEVFTEEIIHTFSPDLAFYFNEPDFNDTDAIRKDALAAAAAGILDDDEVREHYFFLPKKTPEQLAADEAKRQAALDIAQTQQPQDTPQNKPQDSQQSGGKADSKAGTEATDAPKAKKAVSKALTATEIEAIRQRRETIHDQLEADIHPEIVSFFDRQQARYLDKAATTFATAKSAVRKAKDEEVRKGILDDLVQGYFDGSETDDHDLAILLYAKLQDSLNAGSKDAQLQLGFSMDTKAQQKVVDDYLLQNALAHAKGINDTTKAQLTDTLRAGIADGEGIPELRARVKSIFTSATNARATAIARTETAQAFEYANQRAMQESGVVSGKTWLTAKDERTCIQCVPLDGVTVPLDQSFPGGAEPGSIHVSCRCSSIGVVE